MECPIVVVNMDLKRSPQDCFSDGGVIPQGKGASEFRPLPTCSVVSRESLSRAQSELLRVWYAHAEEPAP